ncbi:zinc ribbon domain-containing protein [Bacillus sp. EB600]|uniref:zinc ribbon domain-containing protein n=1 Tax=Bacillus sp. EB600 TaxID=2806345 RepID=UPI0021098172|nr:zinc ribbon domain-containing protein [Bacillus sp. EB600]MCQ6280033.1 zinc ribbon domain-containing protein [Bacillus sp. EB600]
MFCSQCGKQLKENAIFCGNCGNRITVPYIHSQKTDTGDVARKIKKEISNLPLLTLISDAVQGASGLSILQEKIKQTPNDPLYWLFYYECFITHSKIRKGVSTARIVYNPVGFIVSKGVSAGLNTLDDEYQKFDPAQCLKRAISLSRKRMMEKQSTASDFLMIGKCLFYLSQKEDLDKKNHFLLSAIHYISYAIDTETNSNLIGEYFYYLALIYDNIGNKEMYLRSVNLSVSFCFEPSLNLLHKELRANGLPEEEMNKIQIPQSEIITQYQFTWTLQAGERVENTLSYVVESQGKKIKQVSNRIKNLFK